MKYVISWWKVVSSSCKTVVPKMPLRLKINAGKGENYG
jgi:hypothetical protein